MEYISEEQLIEKMYKSEVKGRRDGCRSVFRRLDGYTFSIQIMILLRYKNDASSF